jgi:predicted O-methyltransferase YrrM
LPKDLSKKFDYLEIGSFEGLSSLFILSNWKNANVTCVDTWVTNKDRSQFLDFNFNDVEKKFDLNLKSFSFKKIKSTSVEAFKKIGEKSNFDYVYIDGSHNGVDIYNDALASFKILNVGGLIIFDDITNIYKEIETQPHNAFEKFYYMHKKKN